MVDHFAVLGIPRTAWVDAEELKARFHRLSAERHPDAAGGDGAAFTELNAAWQTLREPAGCLRHFLEIEYPNALASAGTAHAPPELADLFMDIAALRQAAQKFGAKIAAASSPLTKAMLEPERVALRTRTAALTSEIETRTAHFTGALKGNALTPEQLATSLASLVFLGKWSALLSELRHGL
ncbi:MAG: DnaJ domain-containing protein [Chthoniobacteraceae bacterium]